MVSAAIGGHSCKRFLSLFGGQCCLVAICHHHYESVHKINGVEESGEGDGVVTGEDDVMVADRVVEEILGAIGMIFWFENDLCAAQIVLILVSDKFSFVTECPGKISRDLADCSFSLRKLTMKRYADT